MDNVPRSICEQLDIPYSGHQPLTGGDINDVYLVSSGTDRWVFKLNRSHRFPGMFEAEAKGLALLQTAQSFRIPKVNTFGNIGNCAFLILEYLPQGQPSNTFSEVFGRNLATLHETTQANFGLNHDNYIGSLPQFNGLRETAHAFYIEQRLEPQIKMAQDKGFSFNVKTLYKNLEHEIPEESPALVHGDLWSGNYLVDENGKPVLIDPAAAFAPREMDLGMMHLFGGFPESIYGAYHEFFPLISGWKERIPIWQLYYLLVHLNLFGGGYHSQVKRIIDRYS